MRVNTLPNDHVSAFFPYRGPENMRGYQRTLKQFDLLLNIPVRL